LLDEWLDWCQRDPANQQAFDELAAIWEACAGLGPELRASAPAPAQMTRRHFAMAASAAGLGLAAVAGGTWWMSRAPVEQRQVSEHSSPLGHNSSATLPDGSVLELGGGTRVTVSI